MSIAASHDPVSYATTASRIARIGPARRAARLAPRPTIQINHAIVDEKGLIYANDRFRGGLYILRYTGNVPLD
jgi:hypothetical protein